ncbi:manganese efflux pump [Sporosarcina sp. JAI121]|uniref:manganese efflux pump MntP n=1 Tax=Sporosarcina sp. JAI121 TaxID=2723064 RepID=UPI0015CE495F|nr:manganese efflux pump [Sporosarcina sp. JAI121]NYF23486.1 putative Mn2+ efflux pump MntP [Sporosarcina sp. JAI121]
MAEIFAAGITTLDVIVVYSFLQIKKGRFVLALWTAFLNVVFPFLGFVTGELSADIFTVWSSILSGVMLSLIGIHMLLQDDETGSSSKQIPPFFIAFAVSVDAFSVSVSFGMLQMDKTLFIVASALFTLVFSYGALILKGRLGLKDGKGLRLIAGFALLALGILSCFS